MKKLTIAVATVAALVLAGSPALADNNDNKGKGQAKQTEVEINGTVKALVDAKTITVTVKTASMASGTKTVAAAILKAGNVNITADTTTVVKRGSASGLASVVVGDKVNVRATCTVTPLACKATRITATAAPTPTPKPTTLHLSFTLSGVVVANDATTGKVTIVPVKADDGDDNPLNPKSILGTKFIVLTDTATTVTKSGTTLTGPAAVATLVDFPAVSVAGTCTSTAPLACTAKRITVLVPAA